MTKEQEVKKALGIHEWIIHKDEAFDYRGCILCGEVEVKFKDTENWITSNGLNVKKIIRKIIGFG